MGKYMTNIHLIIVQVLFGKPLKELNFPNEIFEQNRPVALGLYLVFF